MAVFFIFNIVTGIVLGLSFISNIFSNDINGKLDSVKVSSNYKVLDIELESINIIIKNSDRFKLETDSDNISVREIGEKLLITEKKGSWLPKKATSDLIVYIPNDFVFENVLIENGAGRIDVESLKTNNLELDLGAGKVTFNKLIVHNNTDIDGGVGEIVIEDGVVNNLDFDIGIGKVTLNLDINGNSEIDSGIGDVDLKLLGNINDYKINLEKGIGKIELDSKNITSSTSYGSGNNIIDINGGIGNIEVDFIS